MASGLLPLAIARIALLRGEYSDFVSALINMVLSSSYYMSFGLTTQGTVTNALGDLSYRGRLFLPLVVTAPALLSRPAVIRLFFAVLHASLVGKSIPCNILPASVD